jgi:hypothetical protein
MRIVAQIFLISLITTAYGQTSRQISIPQYKNGDTTLWYIWQQEKDDKLKLPHLISTTDSFHFRFWKEGQAVDIWTNDYQTVFGQLINYTNSYQSHDDDKRKQKPGKTFSSAVQLDTLLALQVMELMKTIDSIPSEESINGWENGCDGVTYILETSTPTHYYFKSYWTPTAQDSTLLEAKQIQSFVNSVTTLLSLNEEYNKFFGALKPGSYREGMVVTTKFTRQQRKRWVKDIPHRQYLESIEDTLNQYLSDTLTKRLAALGGINCYSPFVLQFSPKNKLTKISLDKHFYDLVDRMEYRKCKRKIRSAFSEVEARFVNCKRSYSKIFNYYDNNVTIINDRGG